MGRKPMSESPKLGRMVILLNDAERAALDSAATAAGKPTSTWARDELLRLATETKPAAKKPARKK